MKIFLYPRARETAEKTLTDIFPLDEEGKTRELVRLLRRYAVE